MASARLSDPVIALTATEMIGQDQEPRSLTGGSGCKLD